MLALAQADDVGMVGAKLLFEDGTLQHGGHVYSGMPMHLYLGRAGDDPGPMGMLAIEREVSGVTAACALVKASVFDAVGGFTPTMAVNYNDVDFSLKIRRAGYRILWTPHAVLYHFESKTRENVVTPAEVDVLRRRWDYELHHDPYHHPKLLPYRDDWAVPYG